ncbi:MAG: imidazolonepropionase [Bacteroidetes bacterium]|nr:MAG: imidazolonepropionase [Bacteroidota bacterium]
MNSKYNQWIPKVMRNLTFFVLFAGILCSTSAQVPAPQQAKPILLKGATIHTQTGHTIENGMLLMENGKITEVGNNVQIPDNAIVKELDGRHIYPALIHGRNLMGLTEIGQVQVTSDFSELGNVNPNVRAETAYHSASTHIGVAAAGGIGVTVTTPTGGLISGLSAAMLTDGWTWDQMTLKAPVGLVVNWPNMLNNRNLSEQLNELQKAFDKARRYHHARNASANQPVDIRWEAMRPVFDGELPVFIQANEISQIQAAVSWAEKENIRMVLTGARDAGYIAEQLAEKNIPVMVGGVIGGPARQWEFYGEAYALPAKLHRAGVNFFIAGDMGAASAYRLPHHAAAAVAFGLPKDEAMKTITLYAAQILGLDDKMGSLEPGKDASIIITNGNPIEFSTQVEMMFLQGRQIDLNSKHRQLYDLYQIKLEQVR